jgi:hypothetical protein
LYPIILLIYNTGKGKDRHDNENKDVNK